LVFLPFMPDAYGVGFNLVVASVWKLALLILFIFVVERYAHQPKFLLVWIGVAYAIPRFGLLVGSNILGLIPLEEGYSFIRLAAITVFVLYLILMVAWIVNSRARKRAERQAEDLVKYRDNPKQALRAKSDILAKEKGLTKRETEVMTYLAEGRDLAYICSECYLSRNTVKSYTKSIYLKVDVHSKQELIDLVDSTPL